MCDHILAIQIDTATEPKRELKKENERNNERRNATRKKKILARENWKE